MAQFDPWEAKLLIESQGGKFFRVQFRRKHDKVVDGVVVAKAGEVRSMLCRRGVKKFVKGVIPAAQRRAEDSKNLVLTVWDCETFHTKLKEIKSCETCQGSGCSFCKNTGFRPASIKAAGQASYRRINLREVESLSFMEKIDLARVAVGKLYTYVAKMRS